MSLHSFALLEEGCITRLDLSVRVRCIEDTSLQDSLGFREAIELDLPVLASHWVVDFIILTVRVDIRDLLQASIELTLCSSALLLSLRLLCLCTTQVLFLGSLFLPQGLHLSFGIGLEVIKFLLGGILISLRILAIL